MGKGDIGKDAGQLGADISAWAGDVANTFVDGGKELGSEGVAATVNAYNGAKAGINNCCERLR